MKTEKQGGSSLGKHLRSATGNLSKRKTEECVWHHLGMEMLFLICPVGAVGGLSVGAVASVC